MTQNTSLYVTERH